MEENWKSEDRGSSQSAGGKKRKGGMMDTHSRGGSENYKDDDDSDGDSSSDDERPSKIEGKLDRSAQLRKEKRLAMNRESARQRRKRKKILIQSLEGQVSELTTQAEEFKASNDRLMARLRSVESELQIANSTISYLLSSQPQGGRAASLPIPGTLLRTNMPFGPALRPQGLGGNAQLDDNLNVLLQAQLASLAQNSPESARSLYQRDGSVRHALDANIFAQMGNRGAPIGSVPHASFYGSRPLGTMRYGTASPGIHAASLENVVASANDSEGDSARLSAGVQFNQGLGGIVSDSLLGSRRGQQPQRDAQNSRQQQLMLIEELLQQRSTMGQSPRPAPASQNLGKQQPRRKNS